MGSLRSILVYASADDEDFAALTLAASLARSSGASLTLVRVLDDVDHGWLRGRRADEASTLREILEKHHRGLLEAHAVPTRAAGTEVRIELGWGAPWRELLRFVARDGHDLVVKAAEGAVRGRGPYLGSTALHLIRESPCPVWIVGDRTERSGLRVVAAIDVRPDSDVRTMSGRVIRLAGRIASDGGELHCAFALRPLDDCLASHLSAEDPHGRLRRRVVAGLRCEIEGLVAAAGIERGRCRIHVLHGDLSEAIPRLVERHGIDLVVLGAANRAEAAGATFAESADALARSLRCGVLALGAGRSEVAHAQGRALEASQDVAPGGHSENP